MPAYNNYSASFQPQLCRSIVRQLTRNVPARHRRRKLAGIKLASPQYFTRPCMFADIESEETRGKRKINQRRQTEPREQIIRNGQKMLCRRPHIRLVTFEPQEFSNRIHRMHGKPGDVEKWTASNRLRQPIRLCGRAVVVIENSWSDSLAPLIAGCASCTAG